MSDLRLQAMQNDEPCLFHHCIQIWIVLRQKQVTWLTQYHTSPVLSFHYHRTQLNFCQSSQDEFKCLTAYPSPTMAPMLTARTIQSTVSRKNLINLSRASAGTVITVNTDSSGSSVV